MMKTLRASTLAVSLLFGSPALAASINVGSDGVTSSGPYPTPMTARSQHNLAVTTATSLTVPPGSVYATVQAAGAAVKYTTDGTTPTSSVGMTLAPGASLGIAGPKLLAAFQAISATGTLDVEYFQ